MLKRNLLAEDDWDSVVRGVNEGPPSNRKSAEGKTSSTRTRRLYRGRNIIAVKSGPILVPLQSPFISSWEGDSPLFDATWHGRITSSNHGRRLGLRRSPGASSACWPQRTMRWHACVKLSGGNETSVWVCQLRGCFLLAAASVSSALTADHGASRNWT